MALEDEPPEPGRGVDRRRAPLIPPGAAAEDFGPPPASGGLRPLRVIADERERPGALGETGGFLKGYTHTLNPAIGCVLGHTFCGKYCYAQHETPARVIEAELGARWGEFLIVKPGLERALRRDLERAARRPEGHRFHISKIRVYLSSCTEPCLGPALEVTRQCLRVFAEFPIGRIVLQTRSPQVLKLLPEIEALAGRLLLSFTIEGDDDAVWEGVDPPLLPRLRDRRAAFEDLARTGSVALSATVSPCVRLASPEEFSRWIARHADFAIVDTFMAGDGRGGARTARTEAPKLLREQSGCDWRDESPARVLYDELEKLMGARAGWSKEGFNALAEVPLPGRGIGS